MRKKPNPTILEILDPLHRSLLNNNLQYDQVSTGSRCIEDELTDEYFTATSAIVLTENTATDCDDAIVKSSKILVDANRHDSQIKEYKQLNHMLNEEQRRQGNDFMHHAFENGNHIKENGKHQLKQHFDRQSKQSTQQQQQQQQHRHEHLNVLDTENRCGTIQAANGSNNAPQQQQQKQQQQHRLTNAKTWSKSHEQITHKLSRRSARNSFENKAPSSLSNGCHTRSHDNNQHCHGHSHTHSKSKRIGANKRQISNNNCSDSSDINSETNLVIENMRNRECEMFRKISFNNGYFDPTDSSSSGSYMYCSKSNTSSMELTSFNGHHCKHNHQNHNKKNKNCACKKSSPQFTAKRKCRSFPLTEHRYNQQSNDVHGNLNENQTIARLNRGSGSDNSDTTTTTTNTSYQTNSRKITITIKTKTIPVQISSNKLKQQKQQQQQHYQQQQQQKREQPQSQGIDKYLLNACETSEESDTTVSDYATLCSDEIDSNAKQMIECVDTNNGFDYCSSNSDDSDTGSDDDDDDNNSFFSIKSDIECQSETSQYFNCASFEHELNAENSNCFTVNEFNNMDDNNKTNGEQNQRDVLKQMQKKSENKTQKNVMIKKSTTPMICIEQELCENRIITSKIEVDKAKIKEFKLRNKKRSPKPNAIIDNSFSEEIFSSAAEIGCDKSVIDDIVSSLDAEKLENDLPPQVPSKCQKNAQNTKQKFISDGFLFDKLEASPKYTGKSINRLLSHRIEQKSITSVRRTLLHNVAYAITEKERQQKLEKKKKLPDLAPIKPPRSFTASSSSSPHSKQSLESSATVPIAELNGNGQPGIGFVIGGIGGGGGNAQLMSSHPRTYEPHVSEESSIQFGWVRPGGNVDNNDQPASRYTTADQYSQTNSTSYYTPSTNQPIQNIGFHIPKEDIDTVDNSSRSNKDFEHFSAILSKSNNLSTPIKDAIPAANTNNNTNKNHREAETSTHTTKPTENLCKNCHCQVKKNASPNVLFGKTGKRIGKAAIKRTKTFIGTSKKFLKNPMTKTKSPIKQSNDEEKFFTPLKEGDNTVCNNRDTNSQEDCKKRVNKSLNLTPKEFNQNIIALNPSPKRATEWSNVRLLKDSINVANDVDKNDSEAYATPDEVFDFEREIDVPTTKMKAVVKRSPSKMLMKWAKSSKKLFHKGDREKDKRRPNVDAESTHYYKANDYDEVDNKVLLMGEMLSDMRKRIENGHSCMNTDEEEPSNIERPSSAKKCLFRDRTISTSSGDILDQDSIVEQIATIDLHDEPEPLYAEIETVQSTKQEQNTLYRSCLATDDDDDADADNNNVKPSIKRCNPIEPVDLKEVYISDSKDSQPSKYIMVNNNPKILYATVNRSSMQTRSLETIESKTDVSEDQIDEQPKIRLNDEDKQSFQLTSSYESFDMSLINLDDFASNVQTELDECQYKINEMFTTATSESNHTGTDEVDNSKRYDRKSNSGSESTAISDLNSGCSSFYRRNKNIVSNRTKKTLSDFVDTLSYDTVGTGSFCESLSQGNDLNNEIKNTIMSLEYMPSEMGDSTDLSNDFATNMAIFRDCLDENGISKDSTKFISLNRADTGSQSSSPSSLLYRTLDKDSSSSSSSSKKLKKMSPSLKAIKTKFRNSFRMDVKKSMRDKNESFMTAGPDLNESSEVKSFTSSSSGSSNADLKRRKVFESICNRLESMPTDELSNGAEMKILIGKIRQQQEMRKSIEQALKICRSNSQFHNSRELVEAEELMLMSNLKECSALEKLVTLWQSDDKIIDNTANETENDFGNGSLSIKYLEFELNIDAIFDTHYNFFYVCVCSHNGQVEFTDAKERKGNRIAFNNLKIQFTNLMADFEIRVEIYALRLRKNAPIENGSEPYLSHSDSSRFRLQGKTLLTSSNLSRRHTTLSYHSPRKLKRISPNEYELASDGLISSAIILCGQKTLCDSIKIGYQEKIYLTDSKANGFLNLADSKQKWDRLWCRIDGFSMHFWKYPQDENNTQSPILTLNLDQCNYRTKSLLVDREICPRARTFKIDVVHAVNPEKRDFSRCIQSYFVSAENQLDLELWLSEIQRIFEIIKRWNI